VPRFLTDVVEEGRLPLGMDVWQNTEVLLPPTAPGRWINVFSQEKVTGTTALAAGEILSRFPCALLINEVAS
jgi:(1->4)-alpha-D-glucan 1-alpha-D-glucosylmutase